MERRTIRAGDYKPLDIPEPHVFCHCCGKRSAGYVEKLTSERKARSKDKLEARKLCRKCYDAAVRQNLATVPPGYPAGWSFSISKKSN